VVVECLGAFFGFPEFDLFRFLAALAAMLCAGAMLGRAFLLTIRLHRADRGSA